MSNCVYGYIEISGDLEYAERAVCNLITPLPIGLQEISAGELYNFPEEHLPRDTYAVIPFNISDHKEVGSAEYLVDGDDYAPEAEIGLPTQASERLDILLTFLEDVCRVKGVKRLVVTINQCNQIDAATHTTPEWLRKIIVHDMAEFAPSDILYIVDVVEEQET